jgi:tRNA threonylcarbamoyladenosine biosynthesis protein TsaE
VILQLPTEVALIRAAQLCATHWRGAGINDLVAGLSGDLGSGKTTWVRALLRALDYGGRVPSPTYTLLEHYEFQWLTVVHLDLYRLLEPSELEHLGIRDWLATPRVWLFAEWPERGGRWVESCDLMMTLSISGPESRTLSIEAQSSRGVAALDALCEVNFN